MLRLQNDIDTLNRTMKDQTASLHKRHTFELNEHKSTVTESLWFPLPVYMKRNLLMISGYPLIFQQSNETLQCRVTLQWQLVGVSLFLMISLITSTKNHNMVNYKFIMVIICSAICKAENVWYSQLEAIPHSRKWIKDSRLLPAFYPTD